MKHRRNIQPFIALSLLMIVSAIAFAHNGVEHVLGTVRAVTENSITVETLKHASVTVMVDAKTIFTHKGDKGLLKDLKTGERVAINARESEDKKLVALTVRWGAAAAMASHAGHKM